jgi:hypothetical protein
MSTDPMSTGLISVDETIDAIAREALAERIPDRLWRRIL